MHTARVVSDHAADGAAAVTRGIGSKCEFMFLGCGPEVVEDDSRLSACDAPPRIELDNLRHVLREVEDYSNIAALARKRCASASTEQRRTVFPADRNRCDYVVVVSWEYHADGNLPVV